VDRNVPSCFSDADWTVAQPSLRTEVERRVKSRIPRGPSSSDHSDVVQDVLNAAVRNRPLLKTLSPSQRSSWFWVVVSRLAMRISRRRSKIVSVTALDDRADADDIPDVRLPEPTEELTRSEQVQAVRKALQTMPESWRRVLLLRDQFPDDWSEVAARCGLSPGASRALWYRALAGLRERLVKCRCFHDESI
jgi:RNA polymerase sigma factor (sigma-70 family)